MTLFSWNGVVFVLAGVLTSLRRLKDGCLHALSKVLSLERMYQVAITGLYYDLENKIIAAIKPRPAFLPVLRMLNGVMEFDETRGLLLTEHWCDRNRRVPVLQSLLKWIPSRILTVTEKVTHLHSIQASPDIPRPVPDKRRRPSLFNPRFKIPRVEWANVLHRIEQGEPLGQIAKSYDVSYESVRRVIRAAR